AQHPVVNAAEWRAVIPFPLHEPVAGIRSEADVCLTSSRLLLLLSLSSNIGLWTRLSSAQQAEMPPSVVRMGISVLEVNRAEVVDGIADLAVREMIERQFRDVRPFEAPEGYDPEKRCRLLDYITIENLI